MAPGHVSHVASCPDVDPVGCADEPIPDHRHEVGVDLVRASLLGAFGIGRGLSVEAELPFDAKILTADYETLEGEPFEPPYGDIHHRDETLSGLGDPVVALRWDGRLSDRVRIGVRGGVSLPLGDTTENPEPLAAESLAHQHMQIGAGTFVPVAGAALRWRRASWGVYGRLDATVPLYESAEGYRPGAQIDVAAGPGYHASSRLFGFAQLAYSRTGQESWDGESNEFSTRDAARLLLGGYVGLGEHWRVGPILQIELASRAVGGRFEQPFMATLTLRYGHTLTTGRGSL